MGSLGKKEMAEHGFTAERAACPCWPQGQSRESAEDGAREMGKGAVRGADGVGRDMWAVPREKSRGIGAATECNVPGSMSQSP